jgi:hypothetical protein
MEPTPPPASAAPIRASRRRLLGVLCYLAGAAVSALAVLATARLLTGAMPTLAGAALALVALVPAVLLLVAAEQCFMPSASEVLARDPRPPVVYLRPFGEDIELTYDVVGSGEVNTVISARAEDFLLALNALGPLVSIAEPNRRARLGLHPFGAYRDFVGEGDWQARVQAWLDRAGLVVLAMGDSPGIEWEIAQVRQRVPPQSLLLYLPPRPADALTRRGRRKKEAAIYARFAPLVEKHFGLSMPPYSEALYLIGFDADGQPVMAPGASRHRWVLTEYGRVKDAIASQLQAVLARVRPGTDLGRSRRARHAGRWARIAGMLTVVLASAALAAAGPAAVDMTVHLTLRLAPSLALLAGWGLLARYFGRRWVWLVPACLGALTMLQGAIEVQMLRDASMALEWLRSAGYGATATLLNLGYAGGVLALGVALAGRRAGHD